MQIAIVQLGPDDMETLKTVLIALKEEFEVLWEQAKAILADASQYLEKQMEAAERYFFQKENQDELEKSWNQQEVMQSSSSGSFFKSSSLPLRHPP